jgi:membrane fusion protein, heavy metal efflux system
MRRLKVSLLLSLLVLGVIFAGYRAGYLDDGIERARGLLRAATVLFGGGSTGEPPGNAGTPRPERVLTLSDAQARSVRVDRVGYRDFPVEREAVGSIDFNNDIAVQVFAPYQGRIIEVMAKVGDDVKAGQPLFTIDSPDLIQAETTLITAAGVLENTTRVLRRNRMLLASQAVSQKDMDQSIADQQSAEGALRAARDAVRIFGRSDADMDRIIADRRVNSSLIIHSPITGRVTLRNAAPGLFVQAGAAPAPFAVADVSTMWLIANVEEMDVPRFRLGQQVRARVMALPGRTFRGRITTVGATIDPATHRGLIRSQIDDPDHLLRPGMLATFTIETAEPQHSLAVPANGVVREGDGTMIVWVATDPRRFVRRTVKVGQFRDGYHQILEGLGPDDRVVVDGALFLSNAALTSGQ